MLLEADKVINPLEGSKAARNITAIAIRGIEEGKLIDHICAILCVSLIYLLLKGKSLIEEEKWKVVQSVAAAMVCLLKVRVALADHLAMLGHLPHVVSLMERCDGVKDLANPDAVAVSNSCLQLLNILAESDECIKRLQTTNIVSVLIKTLQPLHPFSSFTLGKMIVLEKLIYLICMLFLYIPPNILCTCSNK
jgi:hypothetical protein